MNNKNNLGIGCLAALLLFPLWPILIPIMVIIGLCSNGNKSNNKNINNSPYTDEELMAYGLLDEEIKEVKKGNYDPWSFEEPSSGDPLDSDDFYYDDF